MEEILDSTIDHHRRKGRTLSVVMIDLDHFKRFNDTHGHLAGYELLRELGDRLRLRKRLTDSAARLGADPEVAGVGNALQHLGETGLEIESLELPPARAAGRIVGQGAEAVPELVRVLREEAKLI